MFSTCITLIRRNNIITNLWWSIKIISIIRELIAQIKSRAKNAFAW